MPSASPNRARLGNDRSVTRAHSSVAQMVIRLARSRTGNDKQWWSDVAVARDAVLDGSALLWVERLKI
jgi:hypothetical protein